LATHINKFVLIEIVNKIVLLINLIVLAVIVELVITIITVSAFGTAECAAWGILGALWEALEGVTSAIGNAAEVRAGFLLCAGRPPEKQSSAYKPLYLEMFATVLDTSWLFMNADNIPTWMTNDKTLHRMQLFGIGNTSVGNNSTYNDTAFDADHLPTHMPSSANKQNASAIDRAEKLVNCCLH
jgi:Na+-driven multidrug efflux pump